MWDLESALEPPSPRGDKPSAMAAMDITKDSKMMDLYSRQIGAFGVGVMSKLVQARAPLNERHSNRTQIPTPQPRPRRRRCSRAIVAAAAPLPRALAAALV